MAPAVLSTLASLNTLAKYLDQLARPVDSFARPVQKYRCPGRSIFSSASTTNGGNGTYTGWPVFVV